MIFEVRSLSGGYGKKEICRDLTFDLKKGEILCILGPNGSGKSTLFWLLLHFLPPTSGEVLIDGTPVSSLSIRERARAIAYIPQFHTPVFSYTVLEIVTMGRTSHFSVFSSPGDIDRECAIEVLDSLKIGHLWNDKYTTLSGGQRQLVLIARAICQDAKVLIMDEPTSSLDYTNQQLVIDTIHSLSLQGYIIILSTHGPEQPFSCAHKVLLLKCGRMMAYGAPVEALTEQVLQEVYGVEMDVVKVSDRYAKIRYLCLPVKPD